MQQSNIFKGTGKLLIGLSLLLIPAIYSCNNDSEKSGDAKTDSLMVIPPLADSTMKKDTLKKDTIPAIKDTSKGGQVLPITQTRPPRAK
jgi:hypothetical protein